MKKAIFCIALCAATLTSCTQTEVIEEQNAIGFESIVNKPTASRNEDTGAVTGDLSLGSFTEFAAYGYYTKNGASVEIFNGDLVNKATKEVTNSEGITQEVTSWDYSPTRYWVPGANYNFYAYSCADVVLADGKGTATFNANATAENEEGLLGARGLKINQYLCNASHQHDLITAYAEGIGGQTSGNTPVKFTFKHALCKVFVEFVNGLPVDKEGNPIYTIEVSDIELTNFYNQADFEVRTQTWSGRTRVGGTQDVLPLSLTADNKLLTNPAYMLPVVYDNSNLNLNFTLTIKEATGSVMLSRRLQCTWKPVWNVGRAYKYEINLTGEATHLEMIVFEAEQAIEDANNWDNAQTTEISFGVID